MKTFFILILSLLCILPSCSPGNGQRRTLDPNRGVDPIIADEEFSEDELDAIERLCLVGEEASDYYRTYFDRELIRRVYLARQTCTSDELNSLGEHNKVLRKPSPSIYYWEPIDSTAPVISSVFSRSLDAMDLLCDEFDQGRAMKKMTVHRIRYTYRLLNRYDLEGIEVLTEHLDEPSSNTLKSFVVKEDLGQVKEASLWWPCPRGENWHGVIQTRLD